ncbi:MAG: PilZ domain-containing protein [Myxococcota bacterium]
MSSGQTTRNLSEGDVKIRRQVLCLKFADVEQFRREYTANLENGGVFIETTQSVSLRETVEVRMELTGVERTISVPGEVVHIVPPELADAGGKPGAAIQFGCSKSALHKMLEPFAKNCESLESQPADSGRRRSPRVPAQVAVRIEADGEAIVGHTRNLSQSGVLVSVPGQGYPAGEQVRLQLSHPITEQSLSVSAVVVRVVAAEGGVVALAIEFDPVGPEREKLHRFVQDLQSTEHARRLGGIYGSIDEVGMPNLLQMFGKTSPVGTLTLALGEQHAIVEFQDGLIRCAQLGSVNGMKALARILLWTEGSFEFHARLEPVESPGAPLPFDAAMLDATHQVDELLRLDLDALPPEANLRFVSAPVGPGGDVTEKVEQAVLDLARAGFSIQRILDVIPDPDPEILKAISFLVDLGAIQIDFEPR